MLRSGFILFYLCLGSVFTSVAKVYYVSPSASYTDSCSKSNPCSFQKALDSASRTIEDDIIKVLPGTYMISDTLTYESPGGSGSLTIEALDTYNKPVLDGGRQVKIMVINNDSNNNYVGDSGEVIKVLNIIFKNGKASCCFEERGGGLEVRTGKADVIIEGCEFLENTSQQGSAGGLGVSTNGGNVVLKENIFRGNEANVTGGGAWISADTQGQVEVLQNTFEGNVALFNASGTGAGGGLRISGGIVKVEDNAFKRNGANGKGSDLSVESSSKVEIISNTFEKNTKNGALYVEETVGADDILIANNIFISNGGTYNPQGGGIYLYLLEDPNRGAPRAAVINNTFYGNDADLGGGSSHGYREEKYPCIYITTFFEETERIFPEMMFVFKIQVIPLFASFTTIFRETLIFGEVQELLTLKIYTLRTHTTIPILVTCRKTPPLQRLTGLARCLR